MNRIEWRGKKLEGKALVNSSKSKFNCRRWSQFEALNSLLIKQNKKKKRSKLAVKYKMVRPRKKKLLFIIMINIYRVRHKKKFIIFYFERVTFQQSLNLVVEPPIYIIFSDGVLDSTRLLYFVVSILQSDNNFDCWLNCTCTMCTLLALPPHEYTAQSVQ